MAVKHDSQQALTSLFARKPVADLSVLKEALGTTSRTTVFRALSAAGYYTSYSHAGGYYTLQHIPDFNDDGIWSCGEVLFSRLRTLRATVIPMVAEAPAGQTHSELEARLHLRVYDTLRGLVAEGKIGRVELERLYLFVNPNHDVADGQVAERRRLLPMEEVALRLPAPTVIIEVLLAVIRHQGEDQARIGARLRRGGITQDQVDQVFSHYDLGKKKDRTWKPLPP